MGKKKNTKKPLNRFRTQCMHLYHNGLSRVLCLIVFLIYKLYRSNLFINCRCISMECCLRRTLLNSLCCRLPLEGLKNQHRKREERHRKGGWGIYA
jgi:hypothetical protein